MSFRRKCDIAMVCFPGAERLGRQLAERLDPPPAGPTLQQVDPAGARELIAECRIAWIVLDSSGPGEDFYDLADFLARSDFPALLTRAQVVPPPRRRTPPRPPRRPPLAAPRTRAALSRATLAQADELAMLRHELAVTRRHHGGLRWQMDKLDEELRLAAQVQREFLPRNLPVVEGLDLAAFFRPSGYVGGDVYDVQRLDEDHVGLWIADVVGHGVPAALMTMFVKAALPTKEIAGRAYRIVPPDEALARLNTEMRGRDLGANWFVTACYAIINRRTLQLQLASAGHPPAILVRPGAGPQTLLADGPLLGVFDDEPFTPLDATLQPGDRLILHSDGFETAFSDGLVHDTSRYHREFAALPKKSAEHAIQSLVRRVDAAPGSLHQTDDLTALIADARPKTAPADDPGQSASSRHTIATSAI